MKVFVAGGTGVLGRRVVPALVQQGHDVSVLVRSAAKADEVRASGARPVEVSLFDRPALARAVAGHDVVVNLATSIPPLSKASRAKAWHPNDRIRREGSANLVDAALAAGAGRYVQESVTFLYEDGGLTLIDESAPVRPTSITASALDAEAQARRFGEAGGTAVVLRFGAFYGPDSHHTADLVRFARRGMGGAPGEPDGYVSSIHTDDAAAAVVAALTEAPPGTYNVVDDHPVTREEHDRVLARATGRLRLRPLPRVFLKLLGDKLDHVLRSHRVSNASFRAATGWRPRYPSVREGMPVVVAALEAPGRPAQAA